MRPYLLHHLLRASAEARGDAVALIDRGASITYSELDRRTNQLARLLVGAGVKPGDRVGLYLDKSLESVIGLYGALKAGAAYVPLDPDAPATRLGYMARDCGIRCLLTGKEKADQWASLVDAGASLEVVVALNCLGEHGDGPFRVLDAAAIGAEAESAPAVRAVSVDLAYILYTSGSTGTPKGVMLSHLNALAFVDWAVDQFDLRADDRLSSHAPLHFDLSVFDVFAAAGAGARVVLVPAGTSVFPVQVRRFIEGHGITVWYSVPSVLTMLVLRGGLGAGALPSLRALLFAGEVFPTKYLRRLMGHLPNVRFANLYGPTETNVCTWYDVPTLPEDQSEPIPIGRPIGDVDVFALTDQDRLAADGEVGELYVRGATVMQGYWGDDERTARLLVPNPLRPQSSDRVYRTGDLVQKLADGNYRFLGRRDAQVKSRGYRIELGEIEVALLAHPAVVECAVVAVPDEVLTNRIKAYVVSQGPLEDGELAGSCADHLPTYMIPETFEFLEALPKTSTGKIDRQALSKGSSREA